MDESVHSRCQQLSEALEVAKGDEASRVGAVPPDPVEAVEVARVDNSLAAPTPLPSLFIFELHWLLMLFLNPPVFNCCLIELDCVQWCSLLLHVFSRI